MKKLFLLIAAATMSTAMYAQSAADKPADAKTPAAQTAVKHTMHSDFVMADGKLIHCMGERKMPVTRDITLRNGSVLNTKGEVTGKDGTVTTLKNGQCIDMMGKIGTVEEMHAGMKKETPAQKAK